MSIYKMVQIPRNVALASKSMFSGAPDPSRAAAQYLEVVVNSMAAEGWEFQRVDTIGVESNPGCLSSGNKSFENYYVITFKK